MAFGLQERGRQRAQKVAFIGGVVSRFEAGYPPVGRAAKSEEEELKYLSGAGEPEL